MVKLSKNGNIHYMIQNISKIGDINYNEQDWNDGKEKFATF